MADPRNETVIHPFTAFNFAVEIEVPGVSGPKMCSAAFAECDGLEMTMEVKTIREGGNNGDQIRLTGPLAFGLLTLKRGMTATFDLWDWFTAIQEPGNGKLRATARSSFSRRPARRPSAAISSWIAACRPSSRHLRSTQKMAWSRSKNSNSPTSRSGS